MRIQKTRVNQVFLNKVDNKFYTITDVTDGVATGVLTVKDQDKYIPVENGTEVKISEKNDRCYRLIFDPNPPEAITADDFGRNGATILFHGEPVEMGEIETGAILGAANRELIFIGKRGDRTSLYTYAPKKNRFEERVVLHDYRIVASDDNKTFIILDQEITEVDSVENDQPVKAPCMVGSCIVVVRCYDEGRNRRRITTCRAASKWDDNTSVEVINGYVYVGSNNVAEGTVFNTEGYRYYSDSENGARKETGEPAKLCYSGIYRTMAYITSKAVLFADNEYRFNTSLLGDYTYIVDQNVDENGTTLIFADAQATGIKTVNYQETADRGVVCKVV
jgi:hypothetical protein